MTTGQPPGQVVVGLLGVTHPHLSARVRSFRELGATFRLAYDVGPELDSFCRELDISAAADARAVLDDPLIDAILVHSKSDRMVSYALAALEAGKHVLVEKPGGTGVEDLTHLARVAGASRTCCQVGYNFRFSPVLDFARECLDESLLGRVTHVRAHGASSRGEHLSAHLNQEADMGGALWVIGCHVLELLVFLCGVPQSVAGTVRKFDAWSPLTTQEDGASAALNYQSLLASFDFTVNDSLEWFETSEITLIGERGRLTVGVLPARWSLFLTEPTGRFPAGWSEWRETYFAKTWTGEEADFTELPQIANRSFFDREAAAFLARMAGAQDKVPSAEDALDVARVIAAIYESDKREGIRIDLRSP